MMVTWPRTSAFSVVSIALLNGGNCQAYNTISTPTRAIAAKPIDESTRTRSERGSVAGVDGGATPSGVAAMALVVVVVGSVMKVWHRWWSRKALE